MNKVSVQRILHRYQTKGIEGLKEEPRSGRPAKMASAYFEKLITTVRRRPRALGLEFSIWTNKGLLSAALSIKLAVRTQIKRSKKAIEGFRKKLNASEVYFYADEFNVSWQPTLRAR